HDGCLPGVGECHRRPGGSVCWRIGARCVWRLAGAQGRPRPAAAHRRPGCRVNGLLGLVAAAAIATGPAASSDSARLAINDCLKRLNPEIDIGYERISARCPDLARRIDASGGSIWLPREWQRPGNDLSAGGLRQLGELLAGDAAAARTVPRQLN